MATFLKIHHENDYNEIEEYIVNLKMVVDVDEENRDLDMADGESFHMVRNSEWEKVMSFVKANEI